MGIQKIESVAYQTDPVRLEVPVNDLSGALNEVLGEVIKVDKVEWIPGMGMGRGGYNGLEEATESLFEKFTPDNCHSKLADMEDGPIFDSGCRMELSLDKVDFANGHVLEDSLIVAECAGQEFGEEPAEDKITAQDKQCFDCQRKVVTRLIEWATEVPVAIAKADGNIFDAEVTLRGLKDQRDNMLRDTITEANKTPVLDIDLED